MFTLLINKEAEVKFKKEHEIPSQSTGEKVTNLSDSSVLFAKE